MSPLMSHDVYTNLMDAPDAWTGWTLHVWCWSVS